MNVKYEPAYGSFTYSCMYGCFEADFEGEREAVEAFLAHPCHARQEPCS